MTPSSAPSRVLVTGAAGLIGGRVVARFRADGSPVTATDLPGLDLSAAEAAGADVLRSDLTDLDSLRAAGEGARVVVHCGAVFDHAVPLARMYDVNVFGVRRIVRALEGESIERFVQLSSVAVYGTPPSVPCREDARKSPVNPYDVTKWHGEEEAWQAHRETGLPVTALRPSLVYGPDARYGLTMFLAAIARSARLGRRRYPIPAGGPLVHFVHVDDVVEAVHVLALHPDAVGRSFNVADGTPMRLEVAAEHCARAFGLEPGLRLPSARRALHAIWQAAERGVLNPPLALWDRQLSRFWNGLASAGEITGDLRPRIEREWFPYLVGDHVYDITALEGLGFRHVRPRFDEGLRETVDWLLESRWLPEPRGEAAWRMHEARELAPARTGAAAPAGG